MNEKENQENIQEEKSFFAYISRMSLINRWALMRNNKPENIAEHCMMTAAIAHTLGVISNTLFDGNVDPYKMAVCALYHDAHEVLTGDMPTPVKYNNPSIKQAYKGVEKAANEKLLDMLPEELTDEFNDILNYDEYSYEGRLIKGADTLSAYIKCVEECSMGNNDFDIALASTFSKLQYMCLPEVDYFLANFGDTFGRALDQLD